MAHYNATNTNRSDNYLTPRKAWEDLLPFIPKYYGKTCRIWESAYCDGGSGKLWAEIGDEYIKKYDGGGLGGTFNRWLNGVPSDFKIIHEPYPEKDYFEYEPKGDYVQVVNPPFSLKQKWLRRGLELNKPFAMLIPADTMFTQWFKQLRDEHVELQILLPYTTYKFKGVNNRHALRGLRLECMFVCFKFNLPQKINYLTQ